MKHSVRQWLAAMLSVLMVFTMLPMAVWAASGSPFENNGGAGTSGSPYEISSKEQLESFRDYVNGGNSCEGMYITLTSNIDLNGTEENQWTR